MKSIYEIYVPVTSQQQADRLKAICVKYGLPIWDTYEAFFTDSNYKYFRINDSSKKFWIHFDNANKTPITESEFELLAKEFKQ